MVHAGCVFGAVNHPSRTWTSGSFECVPWNACVHRLDLGLYSHPKESLGSGIRIHIKSKGKILSTGKILTRGESNSRRCIKQDSKPNTLPTSYSGPCMCIPGPKNTTSMTNIFCTVDYTCNVVSWLLNLQATCRVCLSNRSA